MHNNYYFLRQLSAALGPLLSDSVLVSCFSQNKDELILEFGKKKSSTIIKAQLSSGFSCLSFPDSFARAKKNSVDIFKVVHGKVVSGIKQYHNERSFSILLEDRLAVTFKMHSANANVLLSDGNKTIEIFRSNLESDLGLKPGEMDRMIDWSLEQFERSQDSLPATYFTFGKPVWNYLNQKGFPAMSVPDRWQLFQATLKLLEKPIYRIATASNGPHLVLLPHEGATQTFTDPVEAVNEFFIQNNLFTGVRATRTSLLHTINGRLHQAQELIRKSSSRLDDLQRDHHYQVWADLIMANLHGIQRGMEEISLQSFYEPHEMVPIRLKKEFSPQKNAEIFYRKEKNKSIEIARLTQTVQQKQTEVSMLSHWKEIVQQAQKPAGLREASAVLLKKSNEKQKKLSLPYHEFEFMGFEIRVGKNSEDNDELTLRFSFKDDLWLHAKDVSGSHVLIKHQAGKNFPKPVIERAAELAAWHSKRKNETLCPVAYTQKKFVRKRKGDPAGAVVVEREKVIMVEPKK